MTDSAHILVIDNYDSFVYTIVGYLRTLGATVDVVRNDAIDPSTPGVIDTMACSSHLGRGPRRNPGRAKA